MKHYHNKRDLGDKDISYIIVEPGQRYKLSFDNMDRETEFETEIHQGIKFWMNRCKLIIDNNKLETDRLIVWHSSDKIKPKTSGGHFHYYTDREVTFEITEAIDKNPNLGIFNVWTADKKRCYEFTDNSWIEEKKIGDKRIFKAGHSWTKKETPTLEFTLTRVE
jgi:hypothetical protein